MRIRKIVSGTPSQPRMTVYRSNKQIYVQFIDDLAGVTLATASSLDKEVAEAAAGKNKCEVAALVFFIFFLKQAYKIAYVRNIIISDMIYSSMNMSCGCYYQTSDKICWMVISFNFFRYSNSAPCR